MTPLEFDLLRRVPDCLKELRQWVIWRYEQRDPSSKPTKVPHTCQGYRASTTNPEHWSTFEYALKTLRERGSRFASGIGFVFSPEDDLCGIDIDGCYPSDSSEIADWAADIELQFADTYREISPSGQGLKIWCRAKPERCGKWPTYSNDVEVGHVEIYDHGRFFTVTGQAGPDVPRVATDHQDDIDDLIAKLSLPQENGTFQSHPIGEIIPVTKRHNSLLSIAGTLRRRGVCDEAILACLLAMNEYQCAEPHTQEHVQRIVRSTERWAL